MRKIDEEREQGWLIMELAGVKGTGRSLSLGLRSP